MYYPQPPIQKQPGFYNPSFNGSFNSTTFHSYLTHATGFYVKQKVELIEALLGWETGNQYTVMDQAGNTIFYVGEESNMCARQYCSNNRAFTLTVKGTVGQNVLIMERQLDCSCCFGLLCPDTLTVSTPVGQLLGSVVEEFSIIFPKFNIKTAIGQTVLQVTGPCCPLSCCGSVPFDVTNLTGQPVGRISKEWSGFVREVFTDSDNFSIVFPNNLDPSLKAVLLGALFLIDYEYFEKGPTDKNKQGDRRLFA